MRVKLISNCRMINQTLFTVTLILSYFVQNNPSDSFTFHSDCNADLTVHDNNVHHIWSVNKQLLLLSKSLHLWHVTPLHSTLSKLPTPVTPQQQLCIAEAEVIIGKSFGIPEAHCRAVSGDFVNKTEWESTFYSKPNVWVARRFSQQPMRNNNNTVTSHNLSFSRQNPSSITSLAWDI